MHKDEVESVFRRMGLVPVKKRTVQDYCIYVGEGFFDKLPERNLWPEPKHFPHGCYVTFWWVGRDEKLLTGRPLFFDRNHDPEMFLTSRQQARANSAVKDAMEHIGQLRKAMH